MANDIKPKIGIWGKMALIKCVTPQKCEKCKFQKFLKDNIRIIFVNKILEFLGTI